MAVEQVESSTGGGRRGPGGRRLAAQLTSFVGRERDLAEVRGLLQRTRLATLVGSPGVGKTRLAQEVATGLASPSIDVAVVELAALADPSLVPRRVAAAFGVPEEPNRPALDSLGEHLTDRRALLVLDNCEHLVEACAGLAEALLRGCGELRVLATSREPLRVPGETIWRVPSLAVPDLDLDPRRDGLEAIVRSPAVALFVDRARAVLPDFSLTPATAPAVAQIARRLDGIPLAIELAAARVDMLSPQQIAERLDQRFDLLTEGSRTALPRHRTLRSLVDWSHDLLSDGERAVLRRLSVFAGGWTIEAAEEVCAGDGVERAAVLGLLGRLVSKSLVVATQTTGEGEEAPASVRYSMLETFRQYGAERLAEAGEDASVRRRHRDWFLDLAERIQWDLRGPDQGRLFNLLEVEHDNIRGALEWCRRCALAGDVDAIERGFRFGAALNRFWRVRCYWREGRRWLGELFELATEPTEMQARALFVAGDLARQQGEIAEARPPPPCREHGAAGRGDVAGSVLPHAARHDRAGDRR